MKQLLFFTYLPHSSEMSRIQLWTIPKHHPPTKTVRAWCPSVLWEHHSAALLAEALRWGL